jgi:hypothetical protein
MKSRSALPLAVICFAWLAATAWAVPAQESPRAQHCKLINAPQEQFPELVFDDIRLDPSSDLPSYVWQSIVTSIKQTDLEAYPGWVDELQEAAVVNRLQDQGYLRATATVEASNISSDSTHQHVGLTVHIEAGPLFKVSSITFRSTDPSDVLFLSEAELRSLVPLQDGEPFSSSKLELAFDQLRKAYVAQGYVDFVPSPEMRFDNTNHQIAIVLELDQGRQYRIGAITVRGLSPPLENELREKLQSGDVLDSQLINDFYDAHRSALPEDASVADVEMHKDIRAGTVDLVFDFRSCAQIPPDAPTAPNTTAPKLVRQLPKRVSD